MIPIRESGGACMFSVRLQPRARREQITGMLGDALKVSVTAPPIEGRANAACCALLAKILRVPKSSVTIAAGESSRNKQLRVVGISSAELTARLQAALPTQKDAT